MNSSFISSMLLTKNAWEDFFPGTSSNVLQKTEYTSWQTVSGTNVHITNCFFRSITSSSNGGAVCCTSATYFLVESSTFLTCKTTGGYGGAIYFSYSSGQCVLHKVCGNDCITTNTGGSKHGQFAYISVYNTDSSKNYINYSSITRCVNVIQNSWYNVCLFNGKNCCPSMNISMNQCDGRSAICLHPYTASSNALCSLTYSTFADNKAPQYNCITLYGKCPNHEIKYCNIIRNTQNGGSEGIIWIDNSMTIENSCILENTATYIFYTSYTITLSNCTVDKTSRSGSLIIQNTVTKSFIHALNHISTWNCHSEYDAVGILTPITPLHSSSKTVQNRYYTYNNMFLCQPYLKHLVSLIFVFMFNFITPNPSVYS
jgi:hypothetical protein